MIDGATCNATNTSGCDQTPVKVPLGQYSHYGSTAVAVNQATDTVYVLNQGTPGLVSVLNGAKCNASVTSGCAAQPPTVTVGNASGPAGLAVNQTTNTIYVDNTGDDTVSVIDGATCNGTNTSGCGQTPLIVQVGRQSFGYVAVDPATDLVYVTDYLDDAVSIINGATCNATHTAGCDQIPPMVPAGPSPTGVAVDQHNHDVYVTDNGGGPVSFFRFQTPGPRPGSRQASITGRPRSSGSPRQTVDYQSSTTSPPHQPARMQRPRRPRPPAAHRTPPSTASPPDRPTRSQSKPPTPPAQDRSRRHQTPSSGKRVSRSGSGGTWRLSPFCREASESAADAVANVRRTRGVDHLDRL